MTSWPSKANDQLKRIPVIVLTTSTDERDIERCYLAGANSYMKKPVDLAGYIDAIRRLKDCWFEIAILPKEAEAFVVAGSLPRTEMGMR